MAWVLAETGNSSCPRGLQHLYLQREWASEPRQEGVLGTARSQNWEGSRMCCGGPCGARTWGSHSAFTS